MFTAFCGSIGIITFCEFLKSAVFLVGYISTNNLFPEPLSAEEEKKYLNQMLLFIIIMLQDHCYFQHLLHYLNYAFG